MNPVRGGRGVEDGDGSSKGGAKPNVVIVVLESTSGTLVTPSDSAGVSPWARELAQRWGEIGTCTLRRDVLLRPRGVSCVLDSMA